MSHHLDSPIARQDIRLDITDLYLFRGESGTVFAINVCHSIAGDIPIARLSIRRACTSSRSISTATPSKNSRTANIRYRRRAGSNALSCVASRAKKPPIRMHRHGRRGGGTDEAVEAAADFAYGRARPATRSGSSLTCCTRSATPSRTGPASTWRDGIRRGEELFAGHTVYSIVLEVPDDELLGRLGRQSRSACGPWRRSPPMRAAGARSIASGCR